MNPDANSRAAFRMFAQLTSNPTCVIGEALWLIDFANSRDNMGSFVDTVKMVSSLLFEQISVPFSVAELAAVRPKALVDAFSLRRPLAERLTQIAQKCSTRVEVAAAVEAAARGRGGRGAGLGTNKTGSG